MYILGIESSCDESAAAVVKLKKIGRSNCLLNDYRPFELASLISSQIAIHQKYGGVVPEVAAREHVLNILPVIDAALKKAKLKPTDISAIGITKGPGLITSLITGIETARTLSFVWKKPLVEVNHISGHIYANFINQSQKINFPAIILTVSGGHTSLLLMNQQGKIKILGETRDDAAGEAYDKGAKMMGLDYPGGPIISNLAEKYKKQLSQKKLQIKENHSFSFPRPMINSADFDFSFSGLKTALLYQLKKDKNWKKNIPQYCSAYQQAIIDVLVAKSLKAVLKYEAGSLMLTGGVSANQELRQTMKLALNKKFPQSLFFTPEIKYTTDNAAMIAAAAAYLFKQGKSLEFNKINVNPGLQLK